MADSDQCGFGLRLMAECTNLLYGRRQMCGCWRKTLSLEAFGMKAGVLQHGKSCLLGFSGQVDGQNKFKRGAIGYIRDHDPVWAASVCGSETVRGFAVTAKEMLTLPAWTAFADMLAGDGCRDGVTVLGTSLGGALAEIVAGCANRGHLGELQGADLPAFHVDRLFTFGAPPTAVVPIANHHGGQKDGCFPGKRTFLASNSPSSATDLVAYSTSFSGYSHGRQDAVQLMELPGGKFDVRLHPCNAEGTSAVPSWAMILPTLKVIVHHGGFDVVGSLRRQVEENHVMDAYLRGLDNVVDRPGSNVSLGAGPQDRRVSMDPIMMRAVRRIAGHIAVSVGNVANGAKVEAGRT